MLRMGSGEYIYDPVSTSVGYNRDAAKIWLWMPEELEQKIAELSAEIPWAGQVTAVRAR